MKKTVFEGVINGEKFDNVADYNKRLTSLLGSGAKVDAQANTKTVEENDCDKCNCCTDDYTLEEFLDDYDLTSDDLTPGFNEDTADFVSTMFSNLDKVDRETLDNIDLKALEDTMTNNDYLSDLYSAVDNMCTDWLKDYYDDLQGIYNTLETSVAKEQINYTKNSERYVDACKQISNYSDQIKKLQKKINELNAFKDSVTKIAHNANDYLYKYAKYIKLANIFRKFYSPLKHKVKSALTPNVSNDNSKPQVNIKEKKPQQEVNYATGLGGDDSKELKKKIEEVSELLSNTLNDLGLKADEQIIPTPENAANLFKDLFGSDVATEFLNAIKKKKSK